MEDATAAGAPRPRSWVRAAAIGLAVGIAIGATSFVAVAVPFYTLASFEPNGLDRPIIRTGLFRIALPVASLIACVVTGVVARWARRGGPLLPSDERGDRYSTRD